MLDQLKIFVDIEVESLGEALLLIRKKIDRELVCQICNFVASYFASTRLLSC